MRLPGSPLGLDELAAGGLEAALHSAQSIDSPRDSQPKHPWRAPPSEGPDVPEGYGSRRVARHDGRDPALERRYGVREEPLRGNAPSVETLRGDPAHEAESVPQSGPSRRVARLDGRRAFDRQERTHDPRVLADSKGSAQGPAAIVAPDIPTNGPSLEPALGRTNVESRANHRGRRDCGTPAESLAHRDARSVEPQGIPKAIEARPRFVGAHARDPLRTVVLDRERSRDGRVNDAASQAISSWRSSLAR